MCFNDSRQFGTRAGPPMSIVPQPAGAPMEILSPAMRGLTMPPLDRPAAPMRVRRPAPAPQAEGPLMEGYAARHLTFDDAPGLTLAEMRMRARDPNTSPVERATLLRMLGEAP